MLYPAGVPSVNDAVTKGEADELAGAMEIQLLHKATAMRFDSVNTQVEGVRYLFVGLAFCDVLQNFAFAARQQVDRVRDVPAVVVKHGV